MRRREIIGTSVAIADYDEVVGAVEAAVARDSRSYICCAPASTLVFARNDGALAAALAAADIVTPDGMGVVHAARLLGESIDGRVYGPDLMALVLERSRASHFLYGGFDDAALDQLKAALSERFPSAVIAGAQSPPHRKLTDDEVRTIAAEINTSGASVVWVGIGSPKQELWMQQFRELLDAPVLIGVGAAFDFFAGRVAQAPSWMQRASLEWLYRLLQDPVRLGRRYLATLPRFALLVLAQAFRQRFFR
jgi:N-acetylglucosaminyldiphosphoundecaprenol N-acetyl-beta-D-mannosaminyltransferase